MHDSMEDKTVGTRVTPRVTPALQRVHEKICGKIYRETSRKQYWHRYKDTCESSEPKKVILKPELRKLDIAS